MDTWTTDLLASESFSMVNPTASSDSRAENSSMAICERNLSDGLYSVTDAEGKSISRASLDLCFLLSESKRNALEVVESTVCLAIFGGKVSANDCHWKTGCCYAASKGILASTILGTA